MRKMLVCLLTIAAAVTFATGALAEEEKKFGSNVGDYLKEFKLADPSDGKEYTAKTLAADGKDVVLVFMQTACSLCIAEIRDILEAQDDFKGKLNVALMSVDFDPARIKPYKEGQKIPFPILHDKDAVVLESTRIASTPATIVLDAAGKIKAKLNGYDKSGLKSLLKVYTK